MSRKVMRYQAFIGSTRLYYVAALLAGLHCVDARAEIIEVRDVVYRTVGDRKLTINFFLPSEPKSNRPAILWFHGGGWRRGTPKQFEPQSRYLAARGIVCGCVEYRLSEEAPFPACLSDCKAAVRFLRAHANQYGADPERIGVGGGSAGGHLAAMVGLTPGKFEEGPHIDVPSHVALMILFNPPTDLRPMGEAASVKQLLGNAAPTDAQLAEISPVSYVTADAPPTLALHGDKDSTVPHVHSEFLVRLLRQAKVPAQLYTAPGARHSWFNRGEGYDTTLAEVEKFLTSRGFLTGRK